MPSSSAGSMGILSSEVVLRKSFCDDGGMPVMVSIFFLSWLTVQDGVIRRSEAVFSDMTRRGTSAMMSKSYVLLIGAGVQV